MKLNFVRMSDSLRNLGHAVLRIAVALSVVAAERLDPVALGWSIETPFQVMIVCVAILLSVGIATPLVALLATCHFFWQTYDGAEPTTLFLVLGVISLALAMIGAGPWSLDAVFFGRKRIEVPRR